MATSDRAGSGRPYLLLLVAVVVGAVAVSVWGRPTMSRTRRSAPEVTAQAPTLALSFQINENGAMTPSSAEVGKGTRVAVTLTNHSGRAVQAELPGYEDRLAPGSLEPGASWRGEFTADRPGDDFAWVIDGKPSAKFVVKGSHLIEGHR